MAENEVVLSQLAVSIDRFHLRYKIKWGIFSCWEKQSKKIKNPAFGFNDRGRIRSIDLFLMDFSKGI